MSDYSGPVAVVCVGMAGAGKTTFMQRINSHLHAKRSPPYVINLDPAVRHVPFDANIDIRDSVNYQEVMKQYKLGPNGGILTSLNLFATKIDQIVALLEKRTTPPQSQQQQQPSGERPVRTVLVDTPGQIEVFVWSASGDILLASLASTMPTVLAYVIDTPRTAATGTFMSNMLYACSILYKTKLPMILVCNKTDAHDAAFVREWMTDFEAFQQALRAEEENPDGPSLGGAGSGYMGSLLNSMSLVLEEFYSHLSVVGVSSLTGQGIDDFFDAVNKKGAEFMRDYKPELDRLKQQRAADKKGKQQTDLEKLLKEMNVTAQSSSKGKKPAKEEPQSISDLEDEDGKEDGSAESDDDNDADEEDEEQGGKNRALTSRYQQALKDSGSNPKDEDFSFARYIRSANIG